MLKIIKILIFICLANIAYGDPWPSISICDPQSGLPPAERGQINGGIGYSSISNDYWKDSRLKFGISMGLTRMVGLTLSGSNRDLSGFGAFQRGPEDFKLGMGAWPLSLANGHFRAGINANVILPTGYRQQELYYDSLGAMATMPAFSLGQSGGDIVFGSSWMIGNAVELNLFGGMISSSDRKEQAQRWGFSSWIAPFGPAVGAELGFAQSNTRHGELPNTQRITGGLSLQMPWGLRLAPEFSADLMDDPMYGAGIELRFSRLLPVAIFPAENRDQLLFQKMSGLALIAPPQAQNPFADSEQLWHSLETQMERSFEETATLSDLDQPGLPFRDDNPTRFWQSVTAIAHANPFANWLVIVSVTDEQAGPTKGVDVPFVASKPQYRATCTAKVKVVNLLDLSLLIDESITGISKKSATINVELVNGSSETLLSAAYERALLFDAYRDLAEQISFRIEDGEPILRNTPIAQQE